MSAFFYDKQSTFDTVRMSIVIVSKQITMKHFNISLLIRSFFKQFKPVHSNLDPNEKGSFLEQFDPLEEIDLSLC